MILKIFSLLELLLGGTDMSNQKHVRNKTNEKLMHIASPPTRVWDWCMTKDEQLWNDKSNTKKISSIDTF